MSLKIYQVDAFTNRPFAGNPAAVCILPEPRDKKWMQDVAREMNLSETAFLVRRDDGFDLRWFTPTVEVDFCGHATLAAAHAVAEIAGYHEFLGSNDARVEFESAAGRLRLSVVLRAAGATDAADAALARAGELDPADG